MNHISVILIHFFFVFASQVEMKQKNTTTVLKQLRALFKNTQYVTEPLQAYIVLSEDAHQVRWKMEFFN